MDRNTAELIGDQIGEFLHVDGIEDGLDMGKHLRIKVYLNITKPLMRGSMVQVNEQSKVVWCSFECEFLPDFCFVCGVLDHLDRDCSIKLKRGEEPQYGKWLR
jgi:hypothetical protein